VDDDMLIIFADIIFGGDLKPMKEYWDMIQDPQYPAKRQVALFAVQKVKDKEEISKSYGVSKVCFGGVCKIIEKPRDLDILEPLLGLGIYMASPMIFEHVKLTPKNLRTNQFEFTDTLNHIPPDERKFFELKGSYVNINTKEDLKKA
jgi:UTP-glucose-1-phosphate uridylyltransferase